MPAPNFFQDLLNGLGVKTKPQNPKLPVTTLSVRKRWTQYCKENPGAEECRIYDT
jgi:hypothetical protein